MRKFFAVGDGRPTSVGKERLYSLDAPVWRSAVTKQHAKDGGTLRGRLLYAVVQIVAVGGMLFIAGCVYHVLWTFATRGR